MKDSCSIEDYLGEIEACLLRRERGNLRQSVNPPAAPAGGHPPACMASPRRKAACDNPSGAHPLIKLLKLFLSRWSSKCCRNCRGFELERLECLLRASIALSCEAMILTCQSSSCLDGKVYRSIRALPLSHDPYCILTVRQHS